MQSVMTWTLKVLALAFAYLLAGIVVLLWAGGPGHVAPFWPSAGLALAMLLLHGRSLWPGIALGAFALHALIAASAQVPFGLAGNVLLPAGMALAATLQACAGTWLILRYARYPRFVDRALDTLKALLLGGPVSGLVGAIIAVTTLLATGAIAEHDAVAAFGLSWLGISTGVLAVAPFAAILRLQTQGSARRTRISVAVAIVIAVALTLLLSTAMRIEERRLKETEFNLRAEVMASILRTRAAANIDTVQSVAGLFAVGGDIDRQAFRHFVAPIFDSHPDLHGLSWNVRMRPGERGAYENLAVRDGYPDFHITERNEQGRLVPVGERPEHIVVYYIEPYEGNEQALGFDLASNPVRRSILLSVRDSGDVQATPPIRLVQESGSQAGILFMAPIYAGGAPPDGVAERRQRLTSYVSGVFRATNMATEALSAFADAGVDYRMLDSTDDQSTCLVCPPDAPEWLDEPASGIGRARHLQTSTEFDVGGRRWTVQFWPGADYRGPERPWIPWVVLAGGLTFSSLLAAYLLSLVGRAAKIEQVVVERTSELRHANRSLNVEVAERRRAENALQVAHSELEQRIRKRTADLEHSNRELQLEISEREHAEAALVASERRFRAVFDASIIGVAIGDESGRLLAANDYVCNVFGVGREELLGRRLADFFAEKSSDGAADPDAVTVHRVRPVTARDERDVSAAVRQTKLSSDADGSVLLYVIEDVTAQRRFESELRKAQKLESIGMLAGGIAHDFNNLLTAIGGNLSLAALRMTDGDETRQLLAEAEEAVARATGLTQQLLTFAKGGEPVRKVTDLDALVRSATIFSCRGSGASYAFHVDPKLRRVDVDAAQIHQVVSNLVINAVQSMPQGGLVTVAARNLDIDASDELLLPPGEYVQIEFADQGVGIPAANRSRIFDPFFTTKPGGSGLGLATSYSIVRKHGGDIVVESEPGSGTTFRVFLPATSKPARATRGGKEPPPAAGTGRILFMDDEGMIRRLVREMLLGIGYQVDVARDGAEAIGRYQSAMTAGRPYDAVILDLTVPGGLGGKETIERLLELDPQVRALVASGYSEAPVMSDYQRHGFRGVVVKPFTIRDLAQALAAVLAESERLAAGHP